MIAATISVNDNVTLRQVRVDEAETVFALVDQERQYLGTWLPWVKTTLTPNDSQEFINSTLNNRESGSSYGYGMFDGNAFIGHISIMHLDEDDKEPEIGYWISSKMAGQGITTSAVKALTDAGFNQLHLSKIVIKAMVANTASNKVAEKAGYTLVDQQSDATNEGITNTWARVNPQTS
jgi:ribosomal-protein-serine acetyltransferase